MKEREWEKVWHELERAEDEWGWEALSKLGLMCSISVTGCDAQGRGEKPRSLSSNKKEESQAQDNYQLDLPAQDWTVDSGIKIKFLVSFIWSEQKETTRFCTPLRVVKMANEKTLDVPYNPTFCSLSATFGVKWPYLMKVTARSVLLGTTVWSPYQVSQDISSLASEGTANLFRLRLWLQEFVLREGC